MQRVESLHFPQFLEKGERIMAGIKRSSLPVIKFGRGAVDPTVTVTDGGQLRFNTLTQKVFGEHKKIFLDFDAKTRELKLMSTTKPPKDWDEGDLFDLKESKGGGGYISCSTLWNDKAVGIAYDYKASGNQHFKPTLDTEKRKVSFIIPKGALTPAPKQVRTKKVKAASAGAGDDGEIKLD